jgi:hypothetical protein
MYLDALFASKYIHRAVCNLRSLPETELLVHSPLVGRGIWAPVAADLAADGSPVTVPDLAGALAAGPPYHTRLAQVIAESAAGQPAILVGHSGGGGKLRMKRRGWCARPGRVYDR